MPFRYDPHHWRERAEEIRRLAADMADRHAQHMMLCLADDYEKLALRAARISAPENGTQSSPRSHDDLDVKRR